MADTRNTHPTLPPQFRRWIGLVITVILIGSGLYYYVTGEDPFGIFAPEPTPTPVAPTPTPIMREIPTPTVAPSAGDWWQVAFSDPATINDPDRWQGSLEDLLIQRITQAQTSIHVALFELNLTPVADALVAARERGVEVLVVTDDEHGLEADEEEGHGQFTMLTDAGITVKDDQRGALMHNKFWIFDGKSVWTGSTNITRNGMFRNNNNVIVIDSPELADIYEREFQEMWAGQFGPRSPSTPDQQAVTIDGTPIQVWFAAEDEVIEQLIPLVNQARQSIRVMAFSFTHNTLGQSVLQRAQAGVDVKGIFETTGSETAYSELSVLSCAGVPVRQDGNKGIFHHKVLVLDDTVVTGSLNFSDSANDSNDENTLVITHPAIAALYRQEFDRRWVEGHAPDPADMGCAGQAAAATPSPTPAGRDCQIKGNIRSASGEKIYHLPGDPYYTRVTIDEAEGERWFCSEEDAKAAGWTRVQ